MAIVRLDTGDGALAPFEPAASADDLRLRCATALESAYGFLVPREDPWARLRAEVLCEGRPASDLDARLRAAQGPDGAFARLTLVSGGALGFPGSSAARPSPQEGGAGAGGGDPVGTLEALLIAADARLLHSDWVETAVRALEAHQQADGAFRPEPADDGADDLVDEDVVIFWTATIAGILGRTPVSRTATLDAAGAFLGSRFRPGAVESSYPLLAAYAHFFTNVAHDLADEALQWCGRALEKGFRSRQLDAVATTRVLLTCDAQAMPGATFDAVELLERLLEEQAGDGGFAELALGGIESRVTQTFDAMLAIVRLCGAL